MKVYVKRFRSRPEEGPTLDMTPDGAFRDGDYRDGADWPDHAEATPWANKLIRYAMVIGVLGAFVLVAAVALWLALLMIPIVAAAGIIGYAAYRWRMYKEGR